MKKSTILSIWTIVLILLVSCATKAPQVAEIVPDADPYPQSAREILYVDRGEQFFRSGISDSGDYLIPNNTPEREGCTFNGWWVYCDEGVFELQ
ncbi:MAG: hypothetical protein IJT52_01455, partial [Spirochaetales bacterium]|nr:hypothetical protein [Spirochaetales bacterium]